MAEGRNIYENPKGYERHIEAQRIRECEGRYVIVNANTRIFVKNGEDAKAKVKRFVDRTRNNAK